MEFPESLEEAAELHRKVVEFTSRYSIALNPINYAVWYLYASGRFPKLNEELDETLTNRGACTHEKSLELYRNYYTEDGDGASSKASEAIQSILAELVESIRRITGANAEFEHALGDALRDVSGSPGSIGEIAQSLVKITQDTLKNQSQFQDTLQHASAEVDQLRADLAESQLLAMSDPLTGVFNRRAFDIKFEECLSRSSHDSLIALLVIDIDHFKKFNDTYGHSIGDRVLQAVAKILREQAPENAVVARYGGEEFVVLVRDAERQAVQKLAEGFQQTLGRLRLKQKQTGRTIDQITMSIGVALTDVEDEPESFFDRADSALYQAKDAGRNCVIFAEN